MMDESIIRESKTQEAVLKSIVLANCTVVDAERETPLTDAGVWTHGDEIMAVGDVDEVIRDALLANEVEVIDLNGKYVVPGLVNMHTHLYDAGRPANHEKPIDVAYRIAGHGRRTVEHGVTSVRLVGEPYGADFALRRAIDAGVLRGPRIFTAGRALACTGGHSSASAGTLEADGTDGFRRAARVQLRNGADLIKVMLSGGIAGEHEGLATMQLMPEELRAVTDVAHEWGRKVTAHAGPAEAILSGIENGLDGVEHGYQLTEPVIEVMAARSITFVPTILVTRCESFYRDVGAPDWMIERALGGGADHWRALELAIAHNVPIALGTDMLPAEPIDDTNATIRELEYYVEAGLQPRAALAAATTVPAAWLGRSGKLGLVQKGALADLIAVEKDPLEQISTLRQVHFVLTRGRIAYFLNGSFN